MLERKKRRMIPFFRRSKCLNSLTEVSSNPCTKDVTHEGAGEQVTVVTALMNLIESVDPSRRSGRLAALRGDPVILAFDEAHSLTRRGKIEIPNSLQQWSSLSEFFHVLRSLNGSPVFLLFISTTVMGRIPRFSARKAHDPSSRVQLGTFLWIAPFTDLGFHQFAKRIKVDGSTNL